MSLRSYTPSIQNGSLEYALYTGYVYLPLAENLVEIDVREVVRTDTFSLPFALPPMYAFTCRWGVALYKIISPIGEAFFNGNPPSYKRGYYCPKLDFYCRDRQLIQYDKQYSETYSFVWASGYSPAPDVVPLSPPILGLTEEFVNPVAAVGGDLANFATFTTWSFYATTPATGISLLFNPGCTYVLSLAYNVYLVKLTQVPPPNQRILSQI